MIPRDLGYVVREPIFSHNSHRPPIGALFEMFLLQRFRHIADVFNADCEPRYHQCSRDIA